MQEKVVFSIPVVLWKSKPGSPWLPPGERIMADTRSMADAGSPDLAPSIPEGGGLWVASVPTGWAADSGPAARPPGQGWVLTLELFSQSAPAHSNVWFLLTWFLFKVFSLTQAGMKSSSWNHPHLLCLDLVCWALVPPLFYLEPGICVF